MVSPQDVIHIYQILSAHEILVYLVGGWGIDALLGEQTRPHKDLDVIVLVDDVNRMREILSRSGYSLKEYWSENRWTVDAHQVKTATAFVLHDLDGREIDVHAMRLERFGNGFPAWEQESFFFSPQDLAGEGLVAGYPVRCQSAQNQMVCHTGYPLPEYQAKDLKRLHAKFDIAYPDQLSHLF